MSLRVFHSDLIQIRSCIRPVDELFSNFGPVHRKRVRFCDDKISERSPILDQTRRIHRRDSKSDEDEKLKKMYGPYPIPEFSSTKIWNERAPEEAQCIHEVPILPTKDVHNISPNYAILEEPRKSGIMDNVPKCTMNCNRI